MKSPGKSIAVLEIVLWKDTGRKVARLLITVENTAYREREKV